MTIKFAARRTAVLMACASLLQSLNSVATAAPENRTADVIVYGGTAGGVAAAGVAVVFEKRLKLDGGVRKTGNRITAMTTEDGSVFSGKMFIDATYEGDLLAKAGVAYTVGREANALHGETLNGVQTAYATK